MSLSEKIKSISIEIKEQTITNRRHLHSHPELSYQEYKTSAYVESQLKSLDLDPVTGIADTGLTCLIKGQNPEKRIVALRADMDALPITEANDVDYRSKNEGVMHACGHDVHTSSLLSTANILSQVKDRFEGTVKLIFQPGEEKLPGGASLMIKEGVLQNPAPQSIIGQHVMPFIPTGKVGFRKGMYMASADEIYITVVGKGGHAAMPERFVDPVLMASHLIVALQQVVSRTANPRIPSVLSFGKIIGEGATNVIPNEVRIEGTFRTLNEDWRSEAHKKIKSIAEGVVDSMGGKCDIEIRKGYPFLTNEPALTQRAIDSAKDYLGEENVEELDLWLAAEDFAYYSQEVDACFYRLGTRNEAKGIVSGVHTPTFDIDEDALELGPGLMAWLTIKELEA
ncbi:MAG: M20 family metallopeptidase [Bacteroidota bacterium]